MELWNAIRYGRLVNFELRLRPNALTKITGDE